MELQLLPLEVAEMDLQMVLPVVLPAVAAVVVVVDLLVLHHLTMLHLHPFSQLQSSSQRNRSLEGLSKSTTTDMLYLSAATAKHPITCALASKMAHNPG